MPTDDRDMRLAARKKKIQQCEAAAAAAAAAAASAALRGAAAGTGATAGAAGGAGLQLLQAAADGLEPLRTGTSGKTAKKPSTPRLKWPNQTVHVLLEEWAKEGVEEKHGNSDAKPKLIEKVRKSLGKKCGKKAGAITAKQCQEKVDEIRRNARKYISEDGVDKMSGRSGSSEDCTGGVRDLQVLDKEARETFRDKLKDSIWQGQTSFTDA